MNSLDVGMSLWAFNYVFLRKSRHVRNCIAKIAVSLENAQIFEKECLFPIFGAFVICSVYCLGNLSIPCYIYLQFCKKLQSFLFFKIPRCLIYTILKCNAFIRVRSRFEFQALHSNQSTTLTTYQTHTFFKPDEQGSCF